MVKRSAGVIAAAVLGVNAFAQTASAKLDHIVIAVRDLNAAKAIHSGLGFFIPDASGRHPGGTQNSGAGFSGGAYLELITPYDVNLPGGKSMAESLKKGEGALSAGLEIVSAEQSARDLNGAGIKVKGPTPGTLLRPGDKEPPPTRWWTLGFADELPWRPIFLIQYNRDATTPPRVRQPNPNSATTLSALLIAVGDPAKSAVGYGNIGKAKDREIALPEFGAMAKEIVLDRGSIFLLRATNPDGPTAKRLKDRGEGILGVRMGVTDLDEARKRIGDKDVSGDKQSILVSPENATGVWLEFQVAHP